MAFTFKVDPALGLIFYVGLNATGTEILEAEKAASNSPLRQPNMKIIVDITQGGLDFEWSDIKKVYRMNRNRLENGNKLEATAVITYNNFANTFGDIFRMVGEGIPINLGMFSTLPDAIKWLDLSDKEAEILEIQKELMRKLKE